MTKAHKAVLGSVEDTGNDFCVDIERLIETRLLIQANSGGGKSFLLRKLLEATHGSVQQIVLDPEGEFSTIREKFDFIIAGKSGDIQADPKTASLLAQKVLELNVSIILDLYDLKIHERHLFVKNFLDGLMNASRSLWHPALVIVDEAHIYAPQDGKSIAKESVADLATRGRKRGFSAVLATQRLSKLHKDVAAECNNKLIGRTGLDIDVKRASDELGFSKKESILSLRDLDAGEFYAFGPALTKAVTKIKAGPVLSKHMKAGQASKSQTTVPTAKVKTILAKLSDLPKEAAQDLKDKESMLARIKELERTIRESKRHSDTIPSSHLEEMKHKLHAQITKEFESKYKSEIRNLKTALSKSIQKAVVEIVEGAEAPKFTSLPPKSPSTLYAQTASTPVRVPPIRTNKVELSVGDTDGIKLGACERAILAFLTMRPDRAFTRAQIGAMTGYANSSGGFNNAISKLNQLGLINKVGTDLKANEDQIDEARDILGNQFSEFGRGSLEAWLNKLGKCERSIYEFLLRNESQSFSRDDLGSNTGYAPGSGGFNNAISRLNTLGLIQKNSDGSLSINQEIISL